MALDARCGTSRASSFNGAALRVRAPARPVAPLRAGSSLLVEAAATKAVKAETLKRISSMLVPETVFVAGVNFKGLTVRRGLELLGLGFRRNAPGSLAAPAGRRASAHRGAQPLAAPRARVAARIRVAGCRCGAKRSPSLCGWRSGLTRPRAADLAARR